MNRQEISSRGISRQSGLDIFSSIINYTGEYINYTIGLDPAISISSAYSTTADNPFTDSLINNPPSVINAWYKFFTGGSPYATTTSPAVSGGFSASVFIFYGNNTGSLLAAHSGIYQKLSLIKGLNYNIYIDRIGLALLDSNNGVITVQIYTPQSGGYLKIFENQVNVPMTASDSQTFDAGEFTAQSANDIVMVSFSSPYIGTSNAAITKISIKRKEDYLVPTYAQDIYGNDHKILRRDLGNTIPADET